MISIFIRTYYNDIKWLNYCLQSIHKNLKGWNEIVICIPIGQESLLKHLTKEKVVTCKLYKDDYLFQQCSKLQAYKYCEGDYILFVDSDVIFKEGADVRDYLHDNKPIIGMDKYENVGGAICWKKPTEQVFGENIDYEYMRFSPQLFMRETLVDIAKYFPDLENYVMSQPYRQFSEFNFLGYYCWKMERENYHFIDVSKGEVVPDRKCKQFWSWSGLNEKDLTKIAEIL